MEGTIRSEIWGQICGTHFPNENLKCFQLLPIDQNSKIITQVIQEMADLQSEPTALKNLISIRDIPKIDHTKRKNWSLIKSLFRLNMASCMWMQDAAKVDANTEYDLQEHLESYKVKLKYDLLINLQEKMENYKKLVNEVAWHKMISWFNTGHTGTVDKHLNQCLAELTEMKQCQIIEGVSLYDFVVKDTEKSQKIALHHNDTHTKLVTKFNVYQNVVLAALEMSYKRFELMKEIEEQQIFTKTEDDKDVVLDYGSVRHLTQYLYDTDIENLLYTFKIK